MTYLVMEVHPAYAVVLDSQGRFLHVANRRYQVGQTVQHVIPLSTPTRAPVWKPVLGMAAMAACLCLVFFGYYRPNFTPYGTLRIQINPDIQMTLSQTQRVLDLEGLNDDGETLLQGYSYQGKSQDTVTLELMERAIDLGYLSPGGTVSITVDSSNRTWQDQETDYVVQLLEDQYGDSITILNSDTVVIPVGDDPRPTLSPTTPPAPIPTPVVTPTPSQDDDDDHDDTPSNAGDDDDDDLDDQSDDTDDHPGDDGDDDQDDSPHEDQDD